MPLLRTLLRGLSTQPGYTLMRGSARFSSIRSVVTAGKKVAQFRKTARFLAAREADLASSLFPLLDRHKFVHDLGSDGVAPGLRLPSSLVEEIVSYAESSPCYADRRPNQGFLPHQHKAVEEALHKPVLLAQYFNASEECPAIAKLARDPVLQWIAARYLGSVPTLVGTNMWWTFPVKASAADRDLHAHLFHRDVDDFRFFKFFFYLTDVPSGEGAHVCVVASHQQPPRIRRWDQWNIRRYSDAEIAGVFPSSAIREICGPAGTGFAENTLCVHKGRTPETRARLLLQIQFALFDYGVMHDRRDASALQMIA